MAAAIRSAGRPSRSAQPAAVPVTPQFPCGWTPRCRAVARPWRAATSYPTSRARAVSSPVEPSEAARARIGGKACPAGWPLAYFPPSSSSLHTRAVAFRYAAVSTCARTSAPNTGASPAGWGQAARMRRWPSVRDPASVTAKVSSRTRESRSRTASGTSVQESRAAQCARSPVRSRASALGSRATARSSSDGPAGTCPPPSRVFHSAEHVGHSILPAPAKQRQYLPARST